MSLTAVTNEQIKSGIVNDQRPPLDAIQGDADLVSFATWLIPRCWHTAPEERPTFDGKHNDVEI